MEDASKAGNMAWKHFVFFVILSAGSLQFAECNYNALFDYEREQFFDFQKSFVVDDPIKITLTREINYYGQKYSTLRATKDGTVSFGENTFVNFKRDPQWPIGFAERAASLDKPFITPFHHEGYTATQMPEQYHGRMYWSQYHITDEADLTLTLLERKRRKDLLKDLGTILSHSSVTIETFEPNQYVMITWENVTDHATKNRHVNGSCSATFDDPCPSATFQLVIAADDLNTFAIFNYAKMDVPYSGAHLAGMNGGRGRGWTSVVKCERACLKNKMEQHLLGMLPELQGSSSRFRYTSSTGERPVGDIMGRFIFVVTDDVVVRGGCLPSVDKVRYLTQEDTVEVFPHQVEMLGGQIIQVSGQCQDPYTPVYCRFDQQAVTEGKVTAGMVGWCPVPRLTSRGQVRLEVSSDGITWSVYTFIIVLSPDFIRRLSDDLTMEPWFQVNPSELHVSWNSGELSEDDRATVDIVLVQYKESAGQVAWYDLKTLAEEVPNNGGFRFDPHSDYRFTCEETEDCDDIELGIVDIRLSKDYIESANERQYIAIGPLPMVWYVNRHKTEYIGDDWPTQRCEQWAKEERSQTQWLKELPSCPCSLQQALADWGRWQPDVGCSLFNKDSKCTFNKKAKHCVRSVQPTPNAAGSHCCYDNDNNLIYSQDSYEGSMSSRAHPWGAAPYNKVGTVPSMSHWLTDRIPYYYCCRWSERDYCQYFADRRPTQDCRYYDPPGSAIIYGDPFVTTFDDEAYHFGGAGDFWLVQSPHLTVQARFLETQSNTVMHEQNYLMPTRISSVAVRGGTGSDTVIFTMAPPGDLHPRRLDVKVNLRHYFFNSYFLMWQDFKGFSIVNNEYSAVSPADRDHSNFTVLLKSGAGVQVAERNGLLHAVVVLPPFESAEERNREVDREPASKGLLGTYDEKRVNEYMVPSGGYVPAKDAQDDKIKYDDFAVEWEVKEEQSLFQFNHAVSRAREPRMGAVTDYLKADTRPSDSLVSSECGITDQDYSGPCAHDYYVTGNRTIAADTLRAQEAFENLRQAQRKMWSCGWLNIPFAIKDNINYSAGNTVTVTGCRDRLEYSGGVSGGPTQYRCVQNETDHQPFWDPYEVNYYLCMDDTDDATVAIIIGVVAAVVVITIIVVVAFICYRRRRSQKKESIKTPASARAEAAMDPGTDEGLLARKGNIYQMSAVKKDSEPERV